jgi:hypothetical protein
MSLGDTAMPFSLPARTLPVVLAASLALAGIGVPSTPYSSARSASVLIEAASGKLACAACGVGF